MDHFQRPRHGGSLPQPTHEGWSGSVTGSRFMRIQLRLQDGSIEDACFGTYGCAPAIAAGSYLCDRIIGQSIERALDYTADQLNTDLGELPPARRFCADLAIDALRDALLRVGGAA
jgi:nitrogen fixation NifU-like protein